MSNLENSLRKALAKGNQDDPIFRRRIYEAAANAIHKSLEAKGAATPEAVRAQNLRLADTIKIIESDIKQATAAVAAAHVPEAQSPQAPVSKPAEPVVDAFRVDPAAQSAPSVAPPIAAEPHIVAEPRVRDEAPEPPTAERATLAEVEAPRKRPFASLLTASVAIAILGIGLLWIITTGAFQSAEERDTSVPNPSTVLESESFEGRDPGTATAPATIGNQAADADGWTILFDPADPTTLSLVDGAEAEIASDPFGDYARLTTPSEVAEVQIDVPLSVLRNSGGEQLQLSLTARSDEGAPTQMSVTCEFGSVGDCGRHRFNVGQAENEYLIQLNLPNAGSATSAGRINIATDIQGEGRSIKLLGARIRPVQ